MIALFRRLILSDVVLSNLIALAIVLAALEWLP